MKKQPRIKTNPPGGERTKAARVAFLSLRSDKQAGLTLWLRKRTAEAWGIS
jgi:hypothetical protein